MVVGVTMVKDEADIIQRTVEHMAHHLDVVIVADNGSTDGTLELLADLPCHVVWDGDPAYYQAQKMTRLARDAQENHGATWIVPFDADERWCTEGRISTLLESLPHEAMICEAAVLDHVATGDPEMPYRRREALPLRKVACRAHEQMQIGQGNHSVFFPDHPFALTVTGHLEVRHFPYRSPEQFIRKARNGAAAYAATDLPEEVGKHWRDYGRLSDEQLREVFFKWFHVAEPENDPALVYDPCPVLLRS